MGSGGFGDGSLLQLVRTTKTVGDSIAQSVSPLVEPQSIFGYDDIAFEMVLGPCLRVIPWTGRRLREREPLKLRDCLSGQPLHSMEIDSFEIEAAKRQRQTCRQWHTGSATVNETEHQLPAKPRQKPLLFAAEAERDLLAIREARHKNQQAPKGRHDEAQLRTAVRHGRERGSVTLGGRAPVTRPRVRAADGEGELPIATYELFSSTEILGRIAMEKMVAGLSTRRYPAGLEPAGQQVAEKCSATSKSAVSRRSWR